MSPQSQAICDALGISNIDVAVILGSGLSKHLPQEHRKNAVAYKEIKGLGDCTVAGHAGTLASTKIGANNVLFFCGRFHRYEGLSWEQVTKPVSIAKELGAHTLCVTNASGGLNKKFPAGTIALIKDHINFIGDNPLFGPNDDSLGARFVDMAQTYTPKLRELAKGLAKNQNLSLQEAVYIGVLGPNYETPAEARMLAMLGADIVGMSTVPEVLLAKHRSMNILGLSLITNQSGDDSGLDHNEVLQLGEKSGKNLLALLIETIAHMEIP